MKKVYVKPMTESAEYMHEGNLMVHSDTHIGAKGIDFDGDDTEGDNNDQKKRNLWDE